MQLFIDHKDAFISSLDLMWAIGMPCLTFEHFKTLTLIIGPFPLVGHMIFKLSWLSVDLAELDLTWPLVSLSLIAGIESARLGQVGKLLTWWTVQLNIRMFIIAFRSFLSPALGMEVGVRKLLGWFLWIRDFWFVLDYCLSKITIHKHFNFDTRFWVFHFWEKSWVWYGFLAWIKLWRF